MLVNPYGREPVRFLCDLVNRPLAGAADLTDRCRSANMMFGAPLGENDVVLLAGFLGDWTTVVDADTGELRATRLNLLLARWSGHPRLSNHAGSGWHLHYRADGLPPGAVVAAVGAVGTALHLTGRGIHRLGRCAIDDCDAVFADVSRPGRQSYCGRRCANRDAVRRHRSLTRAPSAAAVSATTR